MLLGYNGFKDLKSLKVDIRLPFIRLGHTLLFLSSNLSLGYLGIELIYSLIICFVVYEGLKRSKSMTNIDIVILCVSLFSLLLINLFCAWLFLAMLGTIFFVSWQYKKIKNFDKKLPLAWIVFIAYLFSVIIVFMVSGFVDDTALLGACAEVLTNL